MSNEIVAGQEWYVWTVRPGKFEVVERYIKEKVPEISKVLYPTVTTEKMDKKGGVKKKKSPLYAGYIFLQYRHDDKNPSVWLKLNKHPFITRYVGPCSAKDLASVDSLQKVERWNNDEVKNFIVGDIVRVNGGVFVGFSGRVVYLTSNSVGVELSSLGKTLKVVFSPEDLDILDREASAGKD
jgi:transcription antitermination factor NusG